MVLYSFAFWYGFRKSSRGEVPVQMRRGTESTTPWPVLLYKVHTNAPGALCQTTRLLGVS